MYRMLRAKQEWIREDLVEFARELVRTRSESLDESAVADLVEAKMKELGYDKILRDEAGNVVGILYGSEVEPVLLLNAHMDTVAGDEQRWSEPPCSGLVADGRLVGLGTADCKGGLAAQVYAGCLLKRSLLPLRGTLVVAATVAEENGRALGVRHLIEQTLPALELQPAFAILAEPTALGLYYGHDGWTELEIRVEGANPFHVDDAANAIFEELEGEREVGTPIESLSVGRPHFENEGGFRRARIGLNRRLNANESLQTVVQQLKHEAGMAAQSAGAVAVDVQVRRENQRLYTGRTTAVQHVTHAWTTDPFSPLMERARQALSAAGCTARPGRFQLGRLGMGTAGGVLVPEFKVPTVCYGPGDENVAHAPDEYIEIDRLHAACYGTAVIAHGLVGVPVCGWTTDEI